MIRCLVFWTLFLSDLQLHATAFFLKNGTNIRNIQGLEVDYGKPLEDMEYVVVESTSTCYLRLASCSASKGLMWLSNFTSDIGYCLRAQNWHILSLDDLVWNCIYEAYFTWENTKLIPILNGSFHMEAVVGRFMEAVKRQADILPRSPDAYLNMTECTDPAVKCLLDAEGGSYSWYYMDRIGECAANAVAFYKQNDSTPIQNLFAACIFTRSFSTHRSLVFGYMSKWKTGAGSRMGTEDDEAASVIGADAEKKSDAKLGIPMSLMKAKVLVSQYGMLEKASKGFQKAARCLKKANNTGLSRIFRGIEHCLDTLVDKGIKYLDTDGLQWYCFLNAYEAFSPIKINETISMEKIAASLMLLARRLSKAFQNNTHSVYIHSLGCLEDAQNLTLSIDETLESAKYIHTTIGCIEVNVDRPNNTYVNPLGNRVATCMVSFLADSIYRFLSYNHIDEMVRNALAK